MVSDVVSPFSFLIELILVLSLLFLVNLARSLINFVYPFKRTNVLFSWSFVLVFFLWWAEAPWGGQRRAVVGKAMWCLPSQLRYVVIGSTSMGLAGWCFFLRELPVHWRQQLWALEGRKALQHLRSLLNAGDGREGETNPSIYPFCWTPSLSRVVLCWYLAPSCFSLQFLPIECLVGSGTFPFELHLMYDCLLFPLHLQLFLFSETIWQLLSLVSHLVSSFKSFL